MVHDHNELCGILSDDHQSALSSLPTTPSKSTLLTNSQLSDSYRPSQTTTETEDSNTDEERFANIIGIIYILND